MEHRACVRPVRALAEGPEAFWTSLEGQADFDGRAFADFVKRNRFFCWLGPVLDDPRAGRAFPPDLLEALQRRRRVNRDRNAVLAAASRDVARALDAAGIACIFLKGLLFAERFYGDPERRHQVDVDLLVAAADLEAALGVLGGAGFDVSVELESGEPMEARLRRIRNPGRRFRPHSVSVGRDGIALDLHWCLRSRWARHEEAHWADTVRASLAGQPVWTLSDEHALRFMLVSIGGDLGRGAFRGKHFLDLYLMLRALEGQLDWEGFFRRRAAEKAERACVNVLALFLIAWECGAELPSLVAALERRRARIALRDEAEALRLMQPGQGSGRRAWRRRVLPRHSLRERLLHLPRWKPQGAFRDPLTPSR